MIRLSPAATLAELDSPHARACDFTRRPMPGFFIVGSQRCRDQRSVNGTVRLALDYVLSLPSKCVLGIGRYATPAYPDRDHDRILHHRMIVNINGERSRLKEKHKAGLLGASTKSVEH